MKQNIKLFLKSLFSNNACIDGARKKPWYAAIIIFFISIILSVIPSSVLELNKHADKNFDSTTFMAREATTEFALRLQGADYEGQMVVEKIDKKTYRLKSKEFVEPVETGHTPYTFAYINKDGFDAKFKAIQDTKNSYFVFTSDTLYIHISDPNNKEKDVLNLTCINAYKKMGADDIKKSFVASEDKTTQMDKTWANWKGLIRKFYNQTRLKAAGLQLIIVSSINVGITLIMGFMIWVLTRGKNNPYRMFNVWECFKISFWAGFTPSVLTCGFGFLIKNFAATLFPLLLGVRVMWLSMKSLRPDGSGYAAE